MSLITPSLKSRVRKLERTRAAAGQHRPETLFELVLVSLKDWMTLPASERKRFKAMEQAAASGEPIPRGTFGWLAQLIGRTTASGNYDSRGPQ